MVENKCLVNVKSERNLEEKQIIVRHTKKTPVINNDQKMFHCFIPEKKKTNNWCRAKNEHEKL